MNGMRQGRILSHKLFFLYVNNIPDDGTRIWLDATLKIYVLIMLYVLIIVLCVMAPSAIAIPELSDVCYNFCV